MFQLLVWLGWFHVNRKKYKPADDSQKYDHTLHPKDISPSFASKKDLDDQASFNSEGYKDDDQTTLVDEPIYPPTKLASPNSESDNADSHRYNLRARDPATKQISNNNNSKKSPYSNNNIFEENEDDVIM